MIPGSGPFPGTPIPGAKRAVREGALLRELCPALVLLQEVNPGSAGILQRAYALTGWSAVTNCPEQRPVRRLPAVTWRR